MTRRGLSSHELNKFACCGGENKCASLSEIELVRNKTNECVTPQPSNNDVRIRNEEIGDNQMDIYRTRCLLLTVVTTYRKFPPIAATTHNILSETTTQDSFPAMYAA